MTVRQENYLAQEAADMLLRGENEQDVEIYVDKGVQGNPFLFKEVWEKAQWILEYGDERI